MDTLDAAPRATRRTHARDVPGAIAVAMIATLGALGVLLGLWTAVQAATDGLDAGGTVRLSPEAPAWSEGLVPCVTGWTDAGGTSCGPGADPEEWVPGTPLPVRTGSALTTEAYGMSPASARMLGAAGIWGGLLAAGAVLLVLVPVVRSTATGRPFAPGNARRLGVAAATVALGAVLASVGPYLAAQQVVPLLDVPDGWIVPALDLVWWPLPVALLLAALALAVRSGTRLAADTEGLV
jgi:hypothetical protein